MSNCFLYSSQRVVALHKSEVWSIDSARNIRGICTSGKRGILVVRYSGEL